MTESEIEEDKKRWWKAHQLLNNTPSHQIRAWLNTLPLDECEDMRRRLNTVRENRTKKNG